MGRGGGVQVSGTNDQPPKIVFSNMADNAGDVTYRIVEAGGFQRHAPNSVSVWTYSTAVPIYHTITLQRYEAVDTRYEFVQGNMKTKHAEIQVVNLTSFDMSTNQLRELHRQLDKAINLADSVNPAGG